MSLTVGKMAELAGVTVRTLHRYDALDLLTPGARSAAGYRLYGDVDFERLHEILFYRELGFGLDEIKTILADPEHDRASAAAPSAGSPGSRRRTGSPSIHGHRRPTVHRFLRKARYRLAEFVKSAIHANRARQKV